MVAALSHYNFITISESDDFKMHKIVVLFCENDYVIELKLFSAN